MVLDKLGSSLQNALAKVARAMFVDEKLVDELVKDMQRALLGADVNVQLVLSLTRQIKERVLKEKPPAGVTQKEYVIKIVYDELVKFLGKEGYKVDVQKKPFVIMTVGLYGSGKTTSISKLAKFFQKRGHKVAAVGLDVHRPAAPEQLEQLSQKLSVPCFIQKGEKSALKIYQKFEKELQAFDVVLVDTAGRDALSDELIQEIKGLYNKIKPDENLLVISADIGQAAQTQAKAFHDAGAITGVIVTKMDGTGRAGGALTACATTGAQIKFIGVGEKVDDLEVFNPQGFVSRLLGMGDLQALLEKAQGAISEEQAQDLGKKLLQGEFNFIDLYEQMQTMSKMGSFSKLVELIPGMGSMKIPKEMLEGQEEKVKKWKYILQSMTKAELEDPELLDSPRVARIAKGSGTSVTDVRELLKQYRQSKKMMKMMKGKDPERMMKKLQAKMGGQG